MARPKVADEDKVRTQLIEALRKGIDGTPMRLQGSTADPGLFPGGQAGARLVQLARTEGLLEEVPPPEPAVKPKGRGKPPVWVVVTAKGQQLVRDQDSPRKLLEGLHEKLEARGIDLAEGVRQTQEQLAGIREAVDVLEKTLRTHFAHFQQTAATLRTTLDQLGTPPVPVVSARPAPAPAADPGKWLDEVVAFVAGQKRLNSFNRPNLKVIFEHLRQTQPTLTLGQFHDGLRGLHQQRRIRLDPYTQALATLQDPEHALYLDREVKYYVDLP